MPNQFPGIFEQWQVYYVENAPFADKNKYVVLVCCHNGQLHGFFINSQRNPFYDKSSSLRVCTVQIYSQEHSWLPHDSWVACEKTIKLSTDALTDHRGDLCDKAIGEIIYCLNKNTIIKPFFKNMILDGN